MLATTGCASQTVKLRASPRSPLVERFQLTARGGPQASDRTKQLLRRYDLHKEPSTDAKVLTRLTEIRATEPDEDLTYALAELSFLKAIKLELVSEAEALTLYWDTVAYSYAYLFDPQFAARRNPYDPEFRGACDLYNGALERSLRIAKKQGVFKPGKRLGLNTLGRSFQIEIVPRGFEWKGEDFDKFEFVSDFEIAGLTNQYSTYGLGVPLIAIRKKSGEEDPTDRYYPKALSFPVTAFLRFEPGAITAGVAPNTAGGSGATCRCELELLDPLEATSVRVCDVEVPLESDLSTPLAYFLDNSTLAGQDTFGFLRPDKAKEVAGLYMLQPYQPGKIPVLMVHGLWSSPMTWMEMFNDLRSLPEIRDNYQFWFYLYPTGQPFLLSAAELRQDLAQMRRVFDPQAREQSLDEMVLVGHSMGGLISKLQTIDSGNDFWGTMSDKPFAQVKADEEVKNRIEQTFFFNANPSVQRVITIGTPHRGSDFSNDFTRYVGRKLVHLPAAALQAPQQLLAQNPDVFKSAKYAEPTTSIDSLSPSCPLLPAVLAGQHPQTVHYHNVVGRMKKGYLSRSDGDGIVPYSSAHLDGVESEVVVEADHVNVHRHPLTVLEVRRILLQHLREVSDPLHVPPKALVTGAVEEASPPGMRRQEQPADGAPSRGVEVLPYFEP